jgi:hypothetical protein
MFRLTSVMKISRENFPPHITTDNNTGSLAWKWHSYDERAVQRYCSQITSWSLRGVNVLSAVRGEYKACRWTEGSYWSAIKRRSDS